MTLVRVSCFSWSNDLSTCLTRCVCVVYLRGMVCGVCVGATGLLQAMRRIHAVCVVMGVWKSSCEIISSLSRKPLVRQQLSLRIPSLLCFVLFTSFFSTVSSLFLKLRFKATFKMQKRFNKSEFEKT